MDYVGSIFRPPSEARSLLLQVTVGCSHNRCAFCAMYRDKRFGPKDFETIAGDIEEARAAGPAFRRAFLCDGDALILPTEPLLRILGRVRERLPWIERVGVYGDTRGARRKTVAELRALREAGLGIVYHGLESGDDETLRRIEKGGTRVEAIGFAEKLRAAGIDHSVIVLLGIGGRERSAAHAAATASVLGEMDPRYAGALATMVVPGTPLHTEREAGRFVLPDRFGLLEELRTIVRDARPTRCRFSANHASNYLPLTGELPADRQRLVALLDEVIARRDPSLLKPEYLRGL